VAESDQTLQARLKGGALEDAHDCDIVAFDDEIGVLAKTVEPPGDFRALGVRRQS